MTKAVVIVGFIVAFAAGLVIGLSPQPDAASNEPKAGHHGSSLAAQLSLTPEQQSQLDKIWSETARRGGRERDDRRRRVYKDREDAIAALIRPEDRSRYDEIQKKHAEQMASLESEWRTSFQAAVEQTKRILTPEQRTKYDEMLRRHEFDRGPRDRRHGEPDRDGGRWGGHRGASRPSSQP